MPAWLGGLQGHFRFHYRLVAKQTNHVTGGLQLLVTLRSGERKGAEISYQSLKAQLLFCVTEPHRALNNRVWRASMLVSIRECGAVEKPQRLPPHLSYASLLFLSLSFHLYNKLVIVNKAAFLGSTLHSGRLPEDHGAAQILAG